jgi:transposase-like protein
MVGHGTKFGRKKEEAIAALLTQRNVEEAARITGIGTQTLYRWMKDPEFDAAYRKAKRAVCDQAITRLQQGSSAAATTVLKIMVDTGAPPSTRLKAAYCVLSHAKDANEMEQMEDRIAALEQSAKLAKRRY